MKIATMLGLLEVSRHHNKPVLSQNASLVSHNIVTIGHCFDCLKFAHQNIIFVEITRTRTKTKGCNKANIVYADQTNENNEDDGCVEKITDPVQVSLLVVFVDPSNNGEHEHSSQCQEGENPSYPGYISSHHGHIFLIGRLPSICWCCFMQKLASHRHSTLSDGKNQGSACAAFAKRAG